MRGSIRSGSSNHSLHVSSVWSRCIWRGPGHIYTQNDLPLLPLHPPPGFPPREGEGLPVTGRVCVDVHWVWWHVPVTPAPSCCSTAGHPTLPSCLWGSPWLHSLADTPFWALPHQSSLAAATLSCALVDGNRVGQSHSSCDCGHKG
ncbi:hypothetical protein UPYG_G00291660 [Umbra pygmaea]|uniref:Uncharacterized protein n=1 Tax=Umbra pygmaea TaxID=75934 RepID=A0ABD0W4W5_UMBPY